MFAKAVAIALVIALSGGAIQAADLAVPSTATVELHDASIDVALPDQLTFAPLRHAIPPPEYVLVSRYSRSGSAN